MDDEQLDIVLLVALLFMVIVAAFSVGLSSDTSCHTDTECEDMDYGR